MHAFKFLTLSAKIEHWPLAAAFTISRGSKTEAVVVAVEISGGSKTGCGECVPYARYGETPESVLDAIEALRPQFAQGLDRSGLQYTMPPCAARNALDCALWDLEAKRAGQPAYKLAGLPEPQPLVTAFTISLDTPEAMAAAAFKASASPLLKIKLGREGDIDRIAAVRKAAPKTELIVDANEGWTPENLSENIKACAAAGVTLIEQPLPEREDAALAGIQHPVPLCADESVHGLASLAALKGKYEAVNIKLDKAGGLTEALAMTEEAARMGFSVMAGCMVATSLGVAPALLYAQKARLADLDGAFLLARDRPNGLRYDGHRVFPASNLLWG
jgi:L-Ala-D/L-Glu epimerase